MSVTALEAKNQAAVLIARGSTSEQAGKAVGVNGRTVRRWRLDPTFEQSVQTARRELLVESVAALGAAARDAIAALHAALGDKSPAIRVRAASVLLGALPVLSEHAELAERLTALEAAASGRGAAA
jgi:hypothetical protein